MTVWIKITKKQWEHLYDEDVDCGWNWNAWDNPIDDEHYPDYFYPTEGIDNTNLDEWWDRTSPKNRTVKITKKILDAIDDILDRLSDYTDDPSDRGRYNSIKALQKKLYKSDPEKYEKNITRYSFL